MSQPRLIAYRNDDLDAILDLLIMGQCVSIVGLSNIGKSELLRDMCSPPVVEQYNRRSGTANLFVYVDCNRMLELSPRGFYETTLRSALETLPPDSGDLRAQLEKQYQIVVNAPGDFAVPLAFNDALIALVERNGRRLVLFFDEFDQVLWEMEARVLLNLRALRDRYSTRLSYVLASVTRPSQARADEGVAEFAEIFASGKHYLGPLTDDDTRRLAAEVFAEAGDSLDEAEGDFVVQQAGGHPALVRVVCRVLMQVESGAPQLYQTQALALAREALDGDRPTRLELVRLWGQLSADEQRAAMELAAGPGQVSKEARLLLDRRGLLRRSARDGGQEAPRLFGELFGQFVRRQGLARSRMPEGVWVDSDSGEVWVDGLPVPTLTDLEYRLLLLLYGRLDKICDKYQLVQAVWGEDYLDQVDDARIEKLVSRLRSKLEEPPGARRYLITVRGRGYRLASVPEIE